MQGRTPQDVIGELEHAARLSPPVSDDSARRALLDGLLDAADRQSAAVLPGVEDMPFVHVWQPIVAAAASLLAHQHLSPTALQDAKLDLLARLVRLGENALWQMFQTHRGLGVSVIAALAPEHTTTIPRDAYDSFVAAMSGARLSPLLRRFPVLRRLIPCTVAFWANHINEMVGRVAGDRPALMARFGIPERAVLSRLHPAAGDTHRFGRNVVVIEFAWGEARRKLVYKPRDMRLEAAFQRLLADPAAHAPLPPLPSLRMWCGDGYGYTGFVAWAAVTGAGELEDFYHEAGRLGALLYILGYSDGHHENMIACGRHLFVVDAETLFTPLARADYRPPRASDRLDAATVLWSRFGSSLAATELFPTWTFIGQAAVDVSAFGADPHSWPQDRAGWRHVNTDIMSRGRQPQTAARALSLPVGPGLDSPFAGHLAPFAEGFRAQLSAMIGRRSDWLREDGLLRPFEGCMGRAILRGTRVYGAISDRQLTAQALSSEEAQAECLTPLDRLFAQTRAPGDLVALGRAEQAQMANRDIPVFAHRVCGTDLLFAQDRRVTGYFENSGLDACRERLRALSQTSIAAQLAVLEGLVAAKSLRLGRDVAQSVAAPYRSAAGIAEDLMAEASRQGGGWLAFDLEADGERFAYRPLGMSLVSGTSGVATFLAATADDKARAFAVRSLIPLLRLSECGTVEARVRWWRDQPVGMRGSGGQLLALWLMAALGIESVRLLDAMRNLIAAAPASDVRERPVDLWSGTSGLIGPLLLADDEVARSLAAMLADGMASWVMTEGMAHGAVGFAHGLAGPLAALARMADLTGEARHRDAVDALLERMSDGACPEEGGMSEDWATGRAGLAVALSCMRGTTAWSKSVERPLAVASRPLTNAFPSRMDLYGGWPGVAMSYDIASPVPHPLAWSAATPADGPTGDARHVGLFTGVCGVGLARLRTPAGRFVRQVILSAGLMPVADPSVNGESRASVRSANGESRHE